MTAVFSALSRHMSRTDALLGAAAGVGLALYVLLLPAQHPDAAASYALGEAGARQAAEAFLAARGYAVESLEAGVALRRNLDLLNALQAGLGRPEVRRLLKDPQGAARVPAYFWEVHYTARSATDPDDGGDEDRPYYAVGVTLHGAVWNFGRNPAERAGPPERRQPPPPPPDRSQRVDRNALQSAFSLPAADSPEVPGARIDLGVFTDSLLATLAFNPTDTLWQRAPAAGFDGRSVLAALAEGGGGTPAAALNPEAAVALARYHLRQTSWSDGVFRADSVWLLPERSDRLARVRFARAEPLYGQQVLVDVGVSAAGVLQDIDVTFEPAGPGAQAAPGAVAEAGGQGGAVSVRAEGSTLSTIAGILQVGLYVLIILVLVIAFFRRFTARLIDGKAALLDGLVAGLLVAVMVGLLRDLNLTRVVESVWIQLLIRLLLVALGGAATAIFAMIISGTTDSLARSEWPAKLRTASLVRLGSFRNVYVGRALLRGVCLAFVLLGILAGMLQLLPGAAIHFNDEIGTFLDASSYQPMTWLAAGNALGAYFVLLFVLLGTGTFIYHLWKKAIPVILVVSVTMALMQGAFIELSPVWYAWLLSGLWGVVLALTFWRYDFLTCFTSFSLALLVWSLNEGWLVEGSPVWMDVVLAGLLMLGLVVLGLLGVASGRTQREVAEYVPAYITELTQQERLKRELEIARQVQMSFLPRRMPDVAGLDIAAMCLAALEVGGDYYDFVEVRPGRLAVVVGDVSGKGTQAAFYMTLTKGFVQTLSREGLSPAEALRRLNTLFYENAPRGTFISMIYGVFDVEARTFTFARAGHNPVILKRSPSQEADLVQPTGLAIGLVAGPTFDDSIEEVTLHLRTGDVLVFYTDGFSEAMNRVKDLYGDDRLARKVGDVGQRSANEILRAVSEDVHHFVEAAGRHDDMTMVVVKLVRSADDVSVDGAHRQATAEAWKA